MNNSVKQKKVAECFDLSYFRRQAPYPSVQGIAKNLNFARILSDSLGDKNSELTAVLTYVYQQVVVKKRDPELAFDLFHIGLVEMTHLNMLSELIYALGQEPKYQNSRKQYWNGSYADGETDIQRMLETNIQEEKLAIIQYQETARRIPHPRIRAILQRIIQDEQLHIEIFQKHLRDYTA